jgi:chorismate mutase
MTDINQFRKNINIIDKKIIKLLENRFETVNKIWKIKTNNNQQLRDKIHEKILINKLTDESNLSKEFIKQIYEQILNENEKYFKQK